MATARDSPWVFPHPLTLRWYFARSRSRLAEAAVYNRSWAGSHGQDNRMPCLSQSFAKPAVSFLGPRINMWCVTLIKPLACKLYGEIHLKPLHKLPKDLLVLWAIITDDHLYTAPSSDDIVIDKASNSPCSHFHHSFSFNPIWNRLLSLDQCTFTTSSLWDVCGVNVPFLKEPHGLGCRHFLTYMSLSCSLT